MLYKPAQDQPIYNLNVAYSIVRVKLAQVDIALQCQRSGAVLQPEGSILLAYMNDTYRLDLVTATVALANGARTVSLRDQILILHYFVQASGAPLTGRQITYRDLPGGMVYYPTFTKRTIQPVIKTFGEKPELLVKAGSAVAARPGQTGDASLVVDVFPRVPLTVILWKGDSEFPAQANLLFDASITGYLEAEDVTIVCETLAWRLVNAARTL